MPLHSAEGHVAHYVDPRLRRAFATCDRVCNPARLEPVDVLAPGLLDAPVRGRDVIAMYDADGPYRRLREALEAVVADPVAAKEHFEDQDLDAESGPWGSGARGTLASDQAPGLKASK